MIVRAASVKPPATPTGPDTISHFEPPDQAEPPDPALTPVPLVPFWYACALPVTGANPGSVAPPPPPATSNNFRCPAGWRRRRAANRQQRCRRRRRAPPLVVAAFPFCQEESVCPPGSNRRSLFETRQRHARPGVPSLVQVEMTDIRACPVTAHN